MTLRELELEELKAQLEVANMRLSKVHAVICSLLDLNGLEMIKKSLEQVASETAETNEALLNRVRGLALWRANICPECYRKKANSAGDAERGYCTKEYFSRNVGASEECRLASLQYGGPR